MQISKRTLFIIGEAIATTVIGSIHGGAGLALTFGLTVWHIRYDNAMPVQQYRIEQRVPHPGAIAPRVTPKKLESHQGE